MHRVPRFVPVRRAFTLLELLVVCAIIGVVTTVVAPRIRATLDSFAVEAAAREVTNALTLGRFAALRHGEAEVRFSASGVTVSAAGRTLLARDLTGTHGVRVGATTALVRYAASGAAVGLSNGSFILTRRARSDTVFVSRLGRVRR